MTIRDDLISARGLIDMPQKWRKDGGLNGERLCAITALWEASCGESDGYLYLYESLPKHFQKAQSDTVKTDCVIDFNDHPDTTHADIMALFDRAIAAQPESAA